VIGSAREHPHHASRMAANLNWLLSSTLPTATVTSHHQHRYVVVPGTHQYKSVSISWNCTRSCLSFARARQLDGNHRTLQHYQLTARSARGRQGGALCDEVRPQLFKTGLVSANTKNSLCCLPVLTRARSLGGVQTRSNIPSARLIPHHDDPLGCFFDGKRSGKRTIHPRSVFGLWKCSE
jgi:hypothetical protein